MLTEKLVKLLEAFPTKQQHCGPYITYDIKQKSLLLGVCIENVRNNFYFEES